MAEATFTVKRLGGLWWIVRDGNQFGPYASEAQACALAISKAKGSEGQGQDADVYVDKPDDGMPLVYRSSAAVDGSLKDH